MKATILILIALFSFSSFSQSTIGKRCGRNSECQDGIYCNGQELCVRKQGTNKKFCQAAKIKACSLRLALRCNETAKRCDKIICNSDFQCNDGKYCTGQEVCRPGLYSNSLNFNKTRWGCSPAKSPCPDSSYTCDERADKCIHPDCTGGEDDKDGDGAISMRCGGSDCDDNDPNRYPGNPETCDARGYDEDCDPSTYGDTDFDKDGLVSNQCCNRDERGNLNCGPDCDDSRYAIQIGTQICLPNSQNELKICGERGIFTCPQGQSCYEQPNGTGVCAP